MAVSHGATVERRRARSQVGRNRIRRWCIRKKELKKKKMRKEKPMIFLRWRKVKAVAAEQTSVGRNLRSISEQGPSNLTEQTKRWPPWVIFRKKEVGGGGGRVVVGDAERDGENR